MSPLFRHKDDDQDDGAAAMQAEIERLGSLPVPALAAEVMIKGFGPDGPGGPGKPGTLEDPTGDERVGLAEIARPFAPGFPGGREELARLEQLLAEGLQALEHASLVRVSWRGGFENYRATRLGRASVERGAVERILAGGGL